MWHGLAALQLIEDKCVGGKATAASIDAAAKIVGEIRRGAWPGIVTDRASRLTRRLVAAYPDAEKAQEAAAVRRAAAAALRTPAQEEAAAAAERSAELARRAEELMQRGLSPARARPLAAEPPGP